MRTTYIDEDVLVAAKSSTAVCRLTGRVSVAAANLTGQLAVRAPESGSRFSAPSVAGFARFRPRRS